MAHLAPPVQPPMRSILCGVCILPCIYMHTIVDLESRERVIMSQDTISKPMALSKFVSEYKDRLPQAVAVTVGKEDTVRGGIPSGADVRVSMCVREIDRLFCFCCMYVCMYVYTTCVFEEHL